MELLGQGKPLVEIAREVGLSSPMVCRVKKYSESVIISEWEKGKKPEEIAEEQGIPVFWVYSVIIKLLKEKMDEKVKSLGLIPQTENRVPENGGTEDPIERGEEGEEGGTNPEDSSLTQRDLPQNLPQSGSRKVKGGDGKMAGEVEEASSTRLLRDLLQRAKGISEDTIEAICSFHEEATEQYENNPYNLLGLLQAYGVKAPKAQFIVSQYMQALHGVPISYQTWWGWGQGTQGGVYQLPPYPYPPVYQNAKQEKNEEIDLDKEMKRLLQAQTIAVLRQQQQPFPTMMPWVSVKLEPVVDSSGKVVKDEFGNPVYKTTTIPLMSPEGMAGGASKTESKGTTLAEDLAKMEKQRADQMEQKYLTLLETASKARVEELEKRLESLASRNPLEDAVEIVEQMKKLGLVGNTGNYDVEKLKLDLEKWKHEQEIAMEKWREEMKLRREEREEGRERMKIFGETIRDGITKIGAPLAGAFADGYRAGAGVLPKSTAPVQQKPISEMSVEELQRMKAELEARMQKAPEIIKKTEELLKEVTAQLEAKTKAG
jgi:hypothetical protein